MRVIHFFTNDGTHRGPCNGSGNSAARHRGTRNPAAVTCKACQRWIEKTRANGDLLNFLPRA